MGLVQGLAGKLGRGLREGRRQPLPRNHHSLQCERVRVHLKVPYRRRPQPEIGLDGLVAEIAAPDGIGAFAQMVEVEIAVGVGGGGAF